MQPMFTAAAFTITKTWKQPKYPLTEGRKKKMWYIYMLFFVQSLSRIQLFETPWTAAHQAPVSIGFSSQEYWSVLPFPYPGDLRSLGIKLMSPSLTGRFLTTEPPGKPNIYIQWNITQLLRKNEIMPCVTTQTDQHR